mmetsp:Transcript_32346/g.80578  ORF Transcript_32346/g.80578 Transcript_32346/m.80578 type:complete len:81 (-) Transcript_32346:1361-1603(-)
MRQLDHSFSSSRISSPMHVSRSAKKHQMLVSCQLIEMAAGEAGSLLLASSTLAWCDGETSDLRESVATERASKSTLLVEA